MSTAGCGAGLAVVVGTGLIGTSIALALRERGTEVWLTDTDQAAARLAAELGAGQVLPPAGRPGGPADIAVLAVPPAAVARSLATAQRQRLARCYTDVASVKELPLREAAELGCDLASFAAGPSDVRPGAIGPGRGPRGPVRRPAVGDLPVRPRPRPRASRPSRSWPGPAGRSRSSCRPPSTTGGWP